MSGNNWYVDLRVATSEAGLAKGQFFIRGLPEPDLINVPDHSTTVPQSAGGMGRQGYAYASVQWNRLTQKQVYAINALIIEVEVSAGEGNGTLWMTLPRTTGKVAGYDLVDVSGLAWMPELTPIGRGAIYNNVQLRLNAVTFENVPSTYA